MAGSLLARSAQFPQEILPIHVVEKAPPFAMSATHPLIDRTCPDSNGTHYRADFRHIH